MKFASIRLGVVLFCAGVSSAHAGQWDKIRDSINSYMLEYEELGNSLDDLSPDTEGLTSKSKSDRSVIQKHYNSLREFYLSKQFRNTRQNASLLDAIKTYSQATNAAQNAFLGQVRTSLKDEPTKLTDFNSCLRSKGVDDTSELQEVDTVIRDSFEQIAKGLDKPYQFTRGRDERIQFWKDPREDIPKFDNALKALNREWKKEAISCCNKSWDAQRCEGLSTKYYADGVAGSPSAGAHQADLDKNLSSTPDVPDPHRIVQSTPTELATLIDGINRDHNLISARRNVEDAASLEEEVFLNAEKTCQDTREKKQKGAQPIAKSLIQNLSKVVKCHVLPSIATNSWDTQYQRLTTTFANMPIEGRDWDVNCDPRETALYDSLRPTDPNVIAEKWGINQNMTNPPWISMLRQLPPVQSPFPMSAMPGGGIVTPYGIIGRQTGTTTAAGSVTSTSSASNSTATGRGTLITSKTTATAATTSTSRLATRRAASRGLAAGVASTRAIRRIATNVAQGKQVAANVNILRSGASNTRNFAEGIVTTNQKMSANERRLSNTNFATEAKSNVRSLAGSRASRTSAASVANSLRGSRTRRGVVSGVQNAATGGTSLTDLQQQNDQERARLERMARMYMDNIESARRQSDSLRQQIFQRIMERDAKVSNLLAQILDKPPKKQAEKVMATRNELMLIDKDLGQMKAQYDVITGSVLEQASMIRQLAALGGSTPIGPGNTWDPRLLNAGAQNSVPTGIGSPAQVLNGVPAPLNPLTTAPGFPTVVGPTRSASASLESGWVEKFLDSWFISPKAFAATQNKLGIFKNEVEWSAGLERFIVDVDNYALSKVKSDEALVKRASKSFIQYQSRWNNSNLRDMDTEMLEAMGLYSQAAYDETSDLIEKSTQGKIHLDPNYVASLQRSQDDAKASLGALDQISLQYKDSYPLSDEENPEVWIGMLPEMLIY